jgi:hypothetical protein
MIKGLDHFTKHFADSSNDFAVIGGVAAHEIMGAEGLSFRATKDIDLVIIARPATTFCQQLVAYIEAGRYEIQESKDGKPTFYRFRKPEEADYPAQIEIFSQRPEDLPLRGNQHIVPIKDAPDGAALSAILLEDDYFELIKRTMQKIKGLPVASTEVVMALKCRAFNDLTDRKAAGDPTANSDEIKKHRNDILRLSQALPQQSRVRLAGLPETHMHRFLTEIEKMPALELKQLFKQFSVSGDPTAWVEEMRRRLF